MESSAQPRGPGITRGWGWSLGAVLLTVAGAVAILLHAGSGVATMTLIAGHKLVPPTVRAWVADHGQPPYNVPTGTTVAAYAPISGGHVFAYSVYVVNGRRCELTYIAESGTLQPVFTVSGGITATCLPVTPASRPGLSLGMDVDAHAVVLFGTAPASADRLRITTQRGAHEFVLPHVSIADQPGREAVILDLTSYAAIERATLLRGAHVLDQSVWSP